MTTVRDLVQASPQKTHELLERLVATPGSASDERTRLLDELKGELATQAQLEERHLLPALREHEETKGLVEGLLEDNRRTRDLLAEIEGTPKDGQAFGAKVAELRQAFQRHIRDDRRELLPAVVKALSGAEVSAIAEEIGDEKAQIETRRGRTPEPRSGGRRARSDGGSAPSGPDEGGATPGVGSIRRKVRASGDTDRIGGTPRVEPSLPSSAPEDPADVRHRATSAGKGSSGTEATAGESPGAAASARVSVSAGGERPVARDPAAIGGALTALLGEQTDHAMRTAAAVGRSTSLSEAAAAQSDFIGGTIRRMVRANECYLALLRGGMTIASSPSFHR